MSNLKSDRKRFSLVMKDIKGIVTSRRKSERVLCFDSDYNTIKVFLPCDADATESLRYKVVFHHFRRHSFNTGVENAKTIPLDALNLLLSTMGHSGQFKVIDGKYRYCGLLSL